MGRKWVSWSAAVVSSLLGFAAASGARAQGIEDAGHVGLSSLLLAIDSAGSEGITRTDTKLGIGAPGLGLTLGVAVSENVDMGIHVMLQHITISSELEEDVLPLDGTGISTESLEVSSDATAVQFMPYFDGVFGDADAMARPFFGLQLGLAHLADGGARVSTAMIGPRAGVHLFAAQPVSVDLFGSLFYQSALNTEVAVTGFGVHLGVGVTAWFGGPTAAPESEPTHGRTSEWTDLHSRGRVGGQSKPFPGRVTRRFDAARNAQVITGAFQTGATRVQFVAAPAIDLDTVAVTVSNLPGYRISPERCQEMFLLVNQQPVPLTDVGVSGSPSVVIQGRTKFETFKPLAAQYSELGVRVCGLDVPLGAHQMEGVKKFLTMMSQAAQDVQAQAPTDPIAPPAPADPAPTAPAATSNGATPAPPAPANQPAPAAP